MKRNRASSSTYLLGPALSRQEVKKWDANDDILQHGWFLEWLENKQYVRSDILFGDKSAMQSLVRQARKSTANADVQLCDIEDLAAEVPPPDACEEHPTVNEGEGWPLAPCDASTEEVDTCSASGGSATPTTMHTEAQGTKAIPVVAPREQATLPTPMMPPTAVPCRSHSVINIEGPQPLPTSIADEMRPVQTSIESIRTPDSLAPVIQTLAPTMPSSGLTSSTPVLENPVPKTDATRHEAHSVLSDPPNSGSVASQTTEVDALDEHENLVRQLDLLRMRFKECKIPRSVEQGNASTSELRNTVQRNMLQLKRNRNIATYKLGMVGCLLVSEIFFARFCRLDMARFMKWHHSNMMTYEELLVEMGESSTPMTNASPSTQLMMLLFFNTCLFLANELLSKWFNVDVLNVMGHITGATMDTDVDKKPQNVSEPSKFEFARDFV